MGLFLKPYSLLLLVFETKVCIILILLNSRALFFNERKDKNRKLNVFCIFAAQKTLNLCQFIILFFAYSV